MNITLTDYEAHLLNAILARELEALGEQHTASQRIPDHARRTTRLATLESAACVTACIKTKLSHSSQKCDELARGSCPPAAVQSHVSQA